MSFFAELKRRKVFRVAVVYAATAFVVLQAADIMLPSLGVPAWALSFLVVVVVLGFPIALVLAWALELTPDGLKRTESSQPPRRPSKARHRRCWASARCLLPRCWWRWASALVPAGCSSPARMLRSNGSAQIRKPLQRRRRVMPRLQPSLRPSSQG
jgi:hypothetical protein